MLERIGNFLNQFDGPAVLLCFLMLLFVGVLTGIATCTFINENARRYWELQQAKLAQPDCGTGFIFDGSTLSLDENWLNQRVDERLKLHGCLTDRQK